MEIGTKSYLKITLFTSKQLLQYEVAFQLEQHILEILVIAILVSASYLHMLICS